MSLNGSVNALKLTAYTHHSTVIWSVEFQVFIILVYVTINLHVIYSKLARCTTLLSLVSVIDWLTWTKCQLCRRLLLEQTENIAQ